MSRTKMSWQEVDGTKLFVYTTFIDHFQFKVKIVRGEGGPQAAAWKEYISTGLQSKDDVVKEALKRSKQWLAEEAEE